MAKADLDRIPGIFEETGLDNWLIKMVKETGKLRPTTIQGKAIPRILAGLLVFFPFFSSLPTKINMEILVSDLWFMTFCA